MSFTQVKEIINNMSHGNMNLTLKVWRQKNANDKGQLATYPVKDISPDMSFLEMFDVLNEQLIAEGKIKSGSRVLAVHTGGVHRI